MTATKPKGKIKKNTITKEKKEEASTTWFAVDAKDLILGI